MTDELKEIVKLLQRQQKQLEALTQGFSSLANNVAWLVNAVDKGDGEDDSSFPDVPAILNFPKEVS